MKSTIENAATPAAMLKDPTLFRQACYVDGGWAHAQSDETLDVDDPATEG